MPQLITTGYLLIAVFLCGSLQQPPGVPPRQQTPQASQPHQSGHQQAGHGHQPQTQGHQPQTQGHGHQPQAQEHAHQAQAGGHGHHGQPLEFSSETHNADHILQHLEHVRATKSLDQMTPEELAFYYFKTHDYDNNNQLDGLEVTKAYYHYHMKTNDTDADEHSTRIYSDDELTELVDTAFKTYDRNRDGYVEYFEYKVVSDAHEQALAQQQQATIV